MKHWIVAFIIVLGYGLLQEMLAQPGFLGRCNILHYDVFAMTQRADHGGGLSFSHHLGYDRITSRRTIWGLSGTYQQLPQEEEENGSLGNAVGHVIPRAVGIDVHVKTFPFLHGGWLAPIGPYFRFSFSLNHVNTTWYPVEDRHPVKNWESHVYAGYGLEFGYSEILLSRLLTDFGVRVCFAETMNSGIGSDAKSRNIAQSIRRREFFKLHLGLGYLFGK